MSKINLPSKSTFFLNFNKESIKPMIDAIVAKYEIASSEIEYLMTKAVTFESDRILFWLPELSQFHYICAHGRFLNYNYLYYNEPEVEVFEPELNELVPVYTDRINTDILREFDSVYED